MRIANISTIVGRYERTEPTFYDFAAGRVQSDDDPKRRFFLDGRDLKPMPVDEWLIRRYREAPEVEDGLDLPDADILSAIHFYIARKAVVERNEALFNTMDVSMLFALGFIVENRIKQFLGQDGHLMYAQVEGREDASSGDESDGYFYDKLALIDEGTGGAQQ